MDLKLTDEIDSSTRQRDQHYWEEHLADELRMETQTEWLRYSREHYAEWVRRYLRGGGRVLKTDAFEEIRGQEVLEALSERFEQVVVADLALPALRQGARLHGNRRVSWVQAPAQVQPYAEASFDAVTSFSTLDHFRTEVEIGDSLRELARVTRVGGQLLITLDNASNPLLAMRNLIPNGFLQGIGLAPYEYGKTLDAEGFRAVLAGTGWAVKEFTAVVHEPRALAVATARYCGAKRWLTPGLYRKMLRPFDLLEKLPTRLKTGYFLLALAERQSDGATAQGRSSL
ncbi:MAG: class I SAM-dependent methyltransferase [Acidobacteria bacterium]|nr:class I SAM-dependent methyltransferase [Acidobacteriota bacterium]